MSERERLYRGWHISSPRMQKPHYSSDRLHAECWIPQATHDHICAASCTALELIRILKSPKANPKLQIATEKPKFFNDGEHWHTTINYHITDSELISKIDAGVTLCEVCKVADAVLIGAITDIDTMIKTEFMMCSDCFDSKADMSRAD